LVCWYGPVENIAEGPGLIQIQNDLLTIVLIHDLECLEIHQNGEGAEVSGRLSVEMNAHFDSSDALSGSSPQKLQ